ncbi:MAG: hypothetical protein GX495_03315 [Chloroflexi bacterium]|jgi:hypothetical protein|nr:hypothetical protein [Chloroflexota bacterium]
MKKAFLLLCLFAACLITGFTLGASAALAREQQARALAGAQVTGQPQEEENQAGIEALPSGQRNILVIGVDDLQADEPALESLWLILYYPPAPGINLAPLFPARLQNDPETGLALDEAFALDENGTPVPAFFESIQRRDLWWNNYMLIDRAGMGKLVDFFGCAVGDAGDCTILPVDEFPSAARDPEGALAAHTALLQALCYSSYKAADLDPLALVDRLQGHFHTDLTSEQILSDWTFLGIPGNRVCRFPTLPDTTSTPGLNIKQPGHFAEAYNG